MDTNKTGQMLADGTSRAVYAIDGQDKLCLVCNESAAGIPMTDITCTVFELLKQAGLPLAYVQRCDENADTFVAQRCKMIPIEVVCRRYADERCSARRPHLNHERRFGTLHRFHTLEYEMYLKTRDRGFEAVRNPEMAKIEGLPIDKPLMRHHVQMACLRLLHPTLPAWMQGADLERNILYHHVLPFAEGTPPMQEEEMFEKMESLARKAFLVLEGAWAQMGYRLIDLKLEFGLTHDGELVIADVIDPTCWQVRDELWRDISNGPLKGCHERAAQYVGQFRIPRQALVFWRASESDEILTFPLAGASGLENHTITISGHKSPVLALEELEEFLAGYPDGGVIICGVGKSNGLGPVLAARSTWSVIAVPVTQKQRQTDVWSSLEMPSNVPLMTVLDFKNATLAALNILAGKNPILYMHRQFEIEKLDR